MIAYTVTCTFADDDIARAFVAWLQHHHMADVARAGAIGAELVAYPRGCECRYRFATRESLETYERERAPRLRAEGLARAEGRVTFARSVGEILLTL